MSELNNSSGKQLERTGAINELLRKRSVVIHPVRTVGLVLLLVAVSDLLVMWAIHLMPKLDFPFEIVLDIVLLTVLMALIFYRFFLVPIRDGEQKRRALRTALDGALKEISVFDSEIAHKILHDPLTDLPNRLLFHDRLEHEISVVDRLESSLAVFFIDPEPISVINETLGHDAGDDVLSQVGERLKGMIRESDTLARMAGDEFAILMPTVDEKLASDIAEKIHQAFEEPFRATDITVDVVLQIGIAIYPLHARDPIDLMRRADIAMRKAKRDVKRTVFYSEDHESQTLMRRKLFRELRDALVKGDFNLLYQPKMDVASGKISGVEALVRLSGSETSPSQFIPVAEQTGLIERLGLWVLEEAMRQSCEWQKEGVNIPVAVNLSVRNLLDAGLTEKIAALLKKYSLDASRIMIEVTESAVMEHAELSLAVLKRLDAMGLKVSIDDFGTGYSSLSYLKALPASELKIDQSFVLHMTASEADEAIVVSTIQLAHNFGLQVVAEGVESAEVLERLKTLGCDKVQGFHISEPLTAEQLNEWWQGEF